MRWCKRCCEPDTRPTCVFDEEGICFPCRHIEQLKKGEIDWAFRKRQLEELVVWARGASNSPYDCIIGVSGGKDSSRQALFAREVGLNPLLVSCAYPPEQHLERGAENLSNLVSLGFDTIVVAPAPLTSKKLMRNCFLKYGNMFNAAELALYGSLPKMALAYQIPMILLGENPATTWGTAAGGSKDYLGNAQRHTNTLQGGDYRRFITDDMSAADVFWYRYPSDEDMDRAKIKIVYLGYFIPDFNDHSNSRIAMENGLHVREGAEANPAYTGGYYNSICLDDDFVLVNQVLKYMKYGYGMASQEVSGRIRYELMTREEGIRFVKRYDGKVSPDCVRRLADYMEMSVEEFWETAERFRNQEIFYKDTNGNWQLKEPLR